MNMNFGKINPCVHCIYIYFVDLRSSLLDTCVLEILLFLCVQDLREPIQETSLSRLYNWGFEFIFIY